MCNFNQVNFLMIHVTCLNYIYGKSFKLSCSRLEKITLNWFGVKLYPFNYK